MIPQTVPNSPINGVTTPVIAYNLIIGSIREMAARNDDFTLEMLNLIERQTQTSDRQQATAATEARR